MKIKSYKIHTTKEFEKFEKTFQKRIYNDKAFYLTKYEKNKIITNYNAFNMTGIPIQITIEQEKNSTFRKITYYINTFYIGFFIVGLIFQLIFITVIFQLNKDQTLLYFAPVLFLLFFISFFGVIFYNISTSFNTIENC